MKYLLMIMILILLVLLTNYFIEYSTFFHDKRGNAIFYRLLLNSIFSGIYFMFVIRKRFFEFFIGFFIGVFSYLILFLTDFNISEFCISNKVLISLEANQQLISLFIFIIIGLLIKAFLPASQRVQ